MQRSTLLEELMRQRTQEPKPMKLTDEQLNQLLAAIQDGEVEYGEKDCEVIGELICEVLEWRKKDREAVKWPNSQPLGGSTYAAYPYLGPSTIPLPEKTATEQMIAHERRLQEMRHMEEERRRARATLPRFAEPTTKRVKGEPFWQASVDRDVWTLFAPNGQKLYTVSGLDMLQMKNPQTEMGRIAEREMAKWKANGGS